MNSKILFVEITEKWQRDYLEKNLRLADSVCFEEGALQDLASPAKEVTVLSTFIKSCVRQKELEKLPSLKLITTRSTGFDHIDVQAAQKRGIAVANVPVYGENTVAEHTFALILSLCRNLRRAYFKTREGNFSLDGLMGFDLKGKRIGVIGTGHIGLHVIRIASGFGMEILAYDVKKNIFLSGVPNCRYVSLDELLSQSDIITLHVPYMPATHHLINQSNVSKIKHSAILINTARGALVETSALVHALDQGILGGAGLDVLEGEEMILEEKRLLETAENREAWEQMQLTLKNHVLLHRDNVIYTPHMAFYSREALTRILDTTIGNIRSFLAGNPENLVRA